MNSVKKLATFAFSLFVIALATSAMAVPPAWMPGFPMRMGPSVMLMWTPVPGASGYNIYKSGKAGDLGSVLSKVGVNNHMDMNLPMDQSGYYTIKAVVGGAESSEASAVGVVLGTKPLDPPKWVGHQINEKQAAVRFDGVQGAAFYNVFKSEKGDGPFVLLSSIQEARFVDPNVEEGKSYYYQVSAIDKNNVESPRSATYTLTVEKQVVVVAAKSWKQVDIMVKNTNNFYGTTERPILQPTWLGVSDSNILVSDENSILIMDPENGNLVTEYKMPADYKGVVGRLRGIYMAPDGVLFTSWMDYNGIRLFSSDGRFLSEFKILKPTKEDYGADRVQEWEEDKNNEPNPRGMAEDKLGRLWVTEPVFRQIHVYDRQGTLVKRIGPPRTRTFTLQDMKAPSQIVYQERLNRMYLIDPTVQTIRAFDCITMDFIKDDKGEYVYGWKRAGGVPGGFQDPRGIDTLPDGSLIITDGIDGRIQVFDPNGEYVGQLVTKAGEAKPKKMGSPMDIKVVNDNLLYITEPLNQRVSVYEIVK